MIWAVYNVGKGEHSRLVKPNAWSLGGKKKAEYILETPKSKKWNISRMYSRWERMSGDEAGEAEARPEFKMCPKYNEKPRKQMVI